MKRLCSFLGAKVEFSSSPPVLDREGSLTSARTPVQETKSGISARLNHSDPMQAAVTVGSLPSSLAETHCPVADSTAMSSHRLKLSHVPDVKDAGFMNSSAAPKVLAIARKAMKDALISDGSAGQLDDAVAGLHPGVTVDLSRSAIPELPEELVDILKDKLERLALSHNQLSSLPVRFSECTSLRYLNIRANQIREFPLSLCHLKHLEILDLAQNQLRVLPPQVANLSSLKVLSISRNQIRELPLCLANMAALQVLKIKGNPIVFPSKDLISTYAAVSSREGGSEVAMTARIKSILKQEAVNSLAEPDFLNNSTTSNDETPRPTRKRAASGRFPIKVSGPEASSTRYHSMGSSFCPMTSKVQCHEQPQSCRSTQRTGAVPSTATNTEERLRSNSETLLCFGQPGRWNRDAEPMPRRPSVVGRLDETESWHRHDGEAKHGSTTQGNGLGLDKSTAPVDSIFQQSIYARRRSVLPKRRRISKCFNPIVAFAKGMLYAVLQIHPMMQQLAILTRNALESQPSLQIVIYSTNCHIEVLELEIQKYDTTCLESKDDAPQTNMVYRACQTLLGAYQHICTLLADSVDAPVDRGHGQYIRTLLISIYNYIMELRATVLAVRNEGRETRPAEHLPSVSLAGVVSDKPAGLRKRNEATMGKSSRLTDASSKEAIQTTTSPQLKPSISDADGLFGKIVACLQNSANIMLRILPVFGGQLTHGLRNAVRKRAPISHIQHWKCLTRGCANAIQHTHTVKREICRVKLNRRGEQPGADFWDLMISFIASWTALVTEIMACINKILLPPDTRARLKPIQESMKATSNAVVGSPWRDVFSSGRCDTGNSLDPSTAPPRRLREPAVRVTQSLSGEGAFVAVALRGNGFDRVDVLPAHRGDAVVLRRDSNSNFIAQSSMSVALEG